MGRKNMKQCPIDTTSVSLAMRSGRFHVIFFGRCRCALAQVPSAADGVRGTSDQHEDARQHGQSRSNQTGPGLHRFIFSQTNHPSRHT